MRPGQEPARPAPDTEDGAAEDGDDEGGVAERVDARAGDAVADARARRPDEESDRWLVDRAVRGGAEAFEVLLRRHQDRVFRIALRMLGDRQDAEDVAQDVAVQLWRALASFTGSSMFSTWLYRLVVNRCLNHQRAGQRRRRETRPLTDTDQPATTIGPEQRAMGAARLDAAATALASLPAEQRAALVLFQVEGLSYREVATILQVSEPAVRSRLERARKNLLAAMKDWS